MKRLRKEFTGKFQSTRLLRGATNDFLDLPAGVRISIHAPLARRDFMEPGLARCRDISIHAPLARRD